MSISAIISLFLKTLFCQYCCKNSMDFHSVKKTTQNTSVCLTYQTLTSLLCSILSRSICGHPNSHCALLGPRSVSTDDVDTCPVGEYITHYNACITFQRGHLTCNKYFSGTFLTLYDNFMSPHGRILMITIFQPQIPPLNPSNPVCGSKM